MIAGATRSRLQAWREVDHTAQHPLCWFPPPPQRHGKAGCGAKLSPRVIGNTTGIFVKRLKADGDITRTGRVPCCSWPEVGSKETRKILPRSITAARFRPACHQARCDLPRWLQPLRHTGTAAHPSGSAATVSVQPPGGPDR